MNENTEGHVDSVDLMLLREALNEAADRLAAKQKQKHAKIVVSLTAGHVYALIAFFAVTILVIVGAVSGK